MRVLAGISWVVSLSCVALCQSGGDKPAFDIADVHVSPGSDSVKDPRHPKRWQARGHAGRVL